MTSLLTPDLPSCSTDIYRGLQSDLSIIGNLAATGTIYLLVFPFYRTRVRSLAMLVSNSLTH